ncbi:MAG TPA: hypothetical protein VIF82_05700 [Burkholderiaceae bacterium]|jgi:mannose-6-phosphate isomerase class I
MTMVKKYWSNLSTEPISEEAIRALHHPQKKFKFYVNTIESGKSFTTNAGHEFVLYVLAGSCKTTIEGIELTLSASELITLEKGSYAFDVLGNEELKVMKVFSLA